MDENEAKRLAAKYGNGSWNLTGMAEWYKLLPSIIASRPEAKFTSRPTDRSAILKFKQRSCMLGKGKRRWPSKEEAEFHAINGMHAYHCEFCTWWHVGHGNRSYEADKKRAKTKW